MTNKHSNQNSMVQKIQSSDSLRQKKKNESLSNLEEIISSSGNMERTLEDLYYVFSGTPGGSLVLKQSLDEDKKNSKNASTISLKLQKKTYNSLAALESDLYTAVTLLLNNIRPTDTDYALVSSFYTFSRKLLIREQKHSITQALGSDAKKYTQDSFPFRSPSNECLFVISPNGPLFSSLAAKSVFDTRPINTEGRAYITQVIPNYSASTKSIQTFANICPASSQSESSALKKRKLKHPTLKLIPSVKWLYYNSYSSYAPTKDMETAIFSEKHLNAVWWKRKNEKLSMKQKKEKDIEKDATKQSDIDQPSTLELDEKLILSYEPINISDELKASKLYKEYNDVNINEIGKLIQTLSEMQSLRIARSQTEEPGELEEQLAFHIQQLLLKQIVSFNLQPRELLPKPLSLSMSFLVLGPSYTGTLPNVPLMSSAEEFRNQHGSYSELQNYTRNEGSYNQNSQKISNIPITLPSLIRNDSYRSFLNSSLSAYRKIGNRTKK
ncbi:hypothetical protein PNEG_02974 [Pneumocystis murina B123]|uniref:Uncharacterized protein n=1 Tax=Pneumocystis murina (strain B123) TaxID=1069680 RepID=M7P4R0_PNEMU|nr:hypothetical protein PNEG_02974 [Pneumocystis murina B123]EMR08805.1 hypothetical protein PNEG_02974 [Pneumocystis murina B123]